MGRLLPCCAPLKPCATTELSVVNSSANNTVWKLLFKADLSLKENEGVSITISFLSFTFSVDQIHVNDLIYSDDQAKFKFQFLET